MIITVTLNPALDKSIEIENFKVGDLNRIKAERIDAGGKGINVSKSVLRMGGTSKALGFLGGSSGGFIKESLDRLDIENDFIMINNETRTNIKIFDPVRMTNTEINDPGPSVEKEYVERLEYILLKSMIPESVIVFSGSLPRGIDAGVYGKWISIARRLGARTILDADGEPLKKGIEAGPFIVKPNIKELESASGCSIRSIKEAESLSRDMIEKYDIGMVVVTLGEKGALFIEKKRSLLARGLDVEAKSTVGAGDAMAAALAISLEQGFDLEETVRTAIAASAASVMTSGTQPGDYTRIMELKEKVGFEYIR